MHRVVGDEGDRGSIRPLQADEADLPVRGTVGVETERDAASRIAPAPVDVRRRETRAHHRPRGRQLFARFLDGSEQRLLHKCRIFRVGVMRVPFRHHQLGQAVGPDFRDGVGVGDAPPDLRRLNPGFAFQLRGELVVNGRREQAQVGGNDEELSRTVVDCRHLVIEGVMHAGRLPGRITGQPLAARGRDIDLHGGGAESAGLRGGDRRQCNRRQRMCEISYPLQTITARSGLGLWASPCRGFSGSSMIPPWQGLVRNAL